MKLWNTSSPAATRRSLTDNFAAVGVGVADVVEVGGLEFESFELLLDGGTMAASPVGLLTLLLELELLPGTRFSFVTATAGSSIEGVLEDTAFSVVNVFNEDDASLGSVL